MQRKKECLSHNYELYHIYFIHFTARENIYMTSLPMCGFIAQLVEHRTVIAEVTGSNPVEVLFFSGFFFPIAQIGKLTAMITLYFDLHPQFKYELYHKYFIEWLLPCARTERGLLAKFKLPTIVSCSILRLGQNIFYIEKFITQLKAKKKKT